MRELPDVDPPIVTITTVYRGASAEVMEAEVTERIEQEVNTIPGIKTLTSISREEVSLITVRFNLDRDVDIAAQDVRDRIARAREFLPEDIEEPIVAKQDANAQEVMWIALYSDRYSTLELTEIAERQFKDRLQTIPGVGGVNLGGEKRQAIRVRLDATLMAAHQITAGRPGPRPSATTASNCPPDASRTSTAKSASARWASSTGPSSSRSWSSPGAMTPRCGCAKSPRSSWASRRSAPWPATTGVRPSAWASSSSPRPTPWKWPSGSRRRSPGSRPGLPAGVKVQHRLRFLDLRPARRQRGAAKPSSSRSRLVLLIMLAFLRNFRSTLIPMIAVPGLADRHLPHPQCPRLQHQHPDPPGHGAGGGRGGG